MKVPPGGPLIETGGCSISGGIVRVIKSGIYEFRILELWNETKRQRRSLQFFNCNAF